jgi:hypothetical protein
MMALNVDLPYDVVLVYVVATQIAILTYVVLYCLAIPISSVFHTGGLMATNGKSGDDRRHGAVRERSQTQTPSGLWVKRDAGTGQFMDVKKDGEPFKGVRREKK